MPGIGLGISKVIKGSGLNLSSTLYNNHILRVEADGGVIDDKPLLLTTIQSMVSAYGEGTVESFNLKLPVTLSPKIFGYKVGTGSGVTLGQACSKLYSLNPSADAVQATEANQPLLLKHSGNNYFYTPRIADNSLSATHSLSYTNTTDTLRVTAKVFLNNQTTSKSDYVVSIGSAGYFRITNKGLAKSIGFRTSISALESSDYTPSATAPHWIRWTFDRSTILYEWSEDGVNWTAIGNPNFSTVGAIGSTTLGSTSADIKNSMSIYYAKIENVTTSQFIEFDANTYNKHSSTWISGNATWTLNLGTATTGYKSHIVTETTVIGDGVSGKMSIASIATNQPNTAYYTIKTLGTGAISGRAANSLISYDATNISLNNGTEVTKALTAKLRQFITIISNGTTSKINIENGTETSGDAGTENGTYLDLFANGVSFGNHIIESVVISSAIDNDATQLIMYELLKKQGDKNISITGDSIASRLFSGSIVQLYSQTTNKLYSGSAVSGSNLAEITKNEPEIWNPYSFIWRSKVGATNIIDIKNIDVLLVWAGVNDFGDDVPLGTLTSVIETTISGAINNGVDNYLARKSGIKVLFITPSANPYTTTTSNGDTLEDIANQIIDVCENLNIPVYDMWTNCGITDANKDTILTDQVHPSDAHMDDVLTPLIAAFLEANV